MFNFIRNKLIQFRVMRYNGNKIKDLILSLLSSSLESVGTDKTYEDAYIRVRYRAFNSNEFQSTPSYEYDVWVKTADDEVRVFNRLRDNANRITDVRIFRKGAWILHMKKMCKDNISDVDVFSEKRESVRYVGDTAQKKLKFLEKKEKIIPKDKSSRLNDVD